MKWAWKQVVPESKQVAFPASIGADCVDRRFPISCYFSRKLKEEKQCGRAHDYLHSSSLTQLPLKGALFKCLPIPFNRSILENITGYASYKTKCWMEMWLDSMYAPSMSIFGVVLHESMLERNLTVPFITQTVCQKFRTMSNYL